MNGQTKAGPVSWLCRHWVMVTIAGLGVLLLGHRWLMAPCVNPNPVKKVVMRGEFPFDRGWELRIQQSFYTRNPLCKRMARVFFIIPQAEASGEVWAPSIVPPRLTGNRYEASY